MAVLEGTLPPWLWVCHFSQSMYFLSKVKNVSSLKNAVIRLVVVCFRDYYV